MSATATLTDLERRTKHDVSPRVTADVEVRKEEGIKREILGCWGVT